MPSTFNARASSGLSRAAAIGRSDVVAGGSRGSGPAPSLVRPLQNAKTLTYQSREQHTGSRGPSAGLERYPVPKTQSSTAGTPSFHSSLPSSIPNPGLTSNNSSSPLPSLGPITSVVKTVAAKNGASKSTSAGPSASKRQGPTNTTPVMPRGGTSSVLPRNISTLPQAAGQRPPKSESTTAPRPHGKGPASSGSPHRPLPSSSQLQNSMVVYLWSNSKG